MRPACGDAMAGVVCAVLPPSALRHLLSPVSVPHHQFYPQFRVEQGKHMGDKSAKGSRAHRQPFSEIVLAAAAVSPTASRTMPGRPRMKASQ